MSEKELKEKLERLRASRGAHRGVLTKRIGEANEILESEASATYSEKCYQGKFNDEKPSWTRTKGTLASPKEGFLYPPGKRCNWVITVPEGRLSDST